MYALQRYTQSLIQHRHSLWLVLVVVMMTALSMIASAQPPSGPNVCYAIADQVNGTNADSLLVMDRLPPFTPLHTGNLIGALGRNNVETAALSLDSTFIYAVDDATPDMLGRVDLATGAWTDIGPLTQATNPFLFGGAPQDMNDIDSLSVHPMTGDLWGLTHTAGAIYLFRIDKTNGSVIQDTFGPGYDYVQLDYSTLVGIPGGSPAPTESDDLGIHPLTGEFFIIANGAFGSGTNDQLVRINVDGLNPPATPGLNTGQVSLTTIGALTDAAGGGFINDMEGFAFFNDGSFYGTTGDNSIPATNDDHLWLIDETSGVSQRIGTFDDPGQPDLHHDFEGLGCLTGGANTMTGQVFCEAVPGFNGIFDGTDTLQPGVPVRLYRDMNNNGLADAGDMLIQSKVTDASGQFSFQVGIAGNFVIEMDGASIPVGSLKTTHPELPVNPLEEADFVNLGTPFSEYGQTDSGNDFGFTCTPVVDLAVDIQISIDPIVVGDTVIYTITIINNGPGDASNITITDILPPELTYISDNGGCLISGGNVLTCDIASLVGGGSVSIQVIMTATSTGSGTATNTTTVTSSDTDHDPGNNSQTLITTITSTPRIPGQGQATPGGYAIQKMGFAQATNRAEWVVSVSNIGSTTGTNVVITDTLPAGLSLTSVSVPGGSYTESGQTVTVTINSIAPGQTVTFSIFTDIVGGTSTTNTACVADPADGSSACATASLVQTLPATGESPLRRSNSVALLLAMLGLSVLARRRLNQA